MTTPNTTPPSTGPAPWATICDGCSTTIFRGQPRTLRGQGVNGARSGVYHFACAPAEPVTSADVEAVLLTLDARDPDPLAGYCFGCPGC